MMTFKRIVWALSLSLLPFFGSQVQAQTRSNQSKTQEEPIFEIIDEMPAFEGDLMSYIATNIRYPKKAVDKGIQGRVVVGFVVERDGSISHVKIARGINRLLDNEAIRVVKGMPKWKPGKHKDKIVRTRYHLPISFRLQ